MDVSLSGSEHTLPAGPPLQSEQISIELATTSKERSKIYRFRYQVYVEEMGKLLTDADHRRRLIIDDLDDDRGLHFYARAGSQIVGAMRLHIGQAGDFPSYLIENMALDRFQKFAANNPASQLSYTSKTMVDPRYRRSQAFYLLSATLYDTLRRQDCPFNFTVGAPYMVALYEQLGHRRYKSNFCIPGYGYMAPMVILTEDVDHLRRVRSPLWRIARKLENSPASAEWFAGEFPGASRYINRQLIGREGIREMLVGRLGQPLDKAVALFRGMDEAEIMTCADAGHIILCEAGDAVVNTTDMSNDVFIVMSGVVAVRRQSPDRRPSVAILRPGQVYGEKVYVARARHNTTVIAQTDTEILVLPRQAIERLTAQHPPVAAKLLHNMGFRTARKYA
jgi:hypothetical protein